MEGLALGFLCVLKKDQALNFMISEMSKVDTDACVTIVRYVNQ